MELIKNFRQFLLESERSPEIDKGWNLIKYFIDWQSAKAPHRSALTDEWPWITFRSRAFLAKIINRRSCIFEYGSGGSSLYFAKRVGQITSVEHDPLWFAKLKHVIEEKGIVNWQGYLVEPEPLPNHQLLDPSDPYAYASADDRFANLSFKHYVTTIDDFPTSSLDFISVDGRARPSCILHAMPRLKKGGYLMLDNSDRDYYMSHFLKNGFYSTFKKTFDNYGPGPYNSIFWRTTIWQKISN
jgi:hypothetical protein